MWRGGFHGAYICIEDLMVNGCIVSFVMDLLVHVHIQQLFFFSSRRRHTRLQGDWSSDVCSSDLHDATGVFGYRFQDLGQAEGMEIRDDVLDEAHHDRQLASLLKNVCPKAANAVHLEIGRASCRERV